MIITADSCSAVNVCTVHRRIQSHNFISDLRNGWSTSGEKTCWKGIPIICMTTVMFVKITSKILCSWTHLRRRRDWYGQLFLLWYEQILLLCVIKVLKLNGNFCYCLTINCFHCISYLLLKLMELILIVFIACQISVPNPPPKVTLKRPPPKPRLPPVVTTKQAAASLSVARTSKTPTSDKGSEITRFISSCLWYLYTHVSPMCPLCSQASCDLYKWIWGMNVWYPWKLNGVSYCFTLIEDNISTL